MDLKIQHSPVTLREICVDKVRKAIIAGYFTSGTRLVERSLCEELGVSRTVVREVIRYLEAEGLVEILPNRGPIVARLDWDTARQIYSIRLQLEQSAVAECTSKLTDQSAKAIQSALLSLKKALKSNDTGLITDASAKLYETIFLTAEQNVAWEIVQRLNSRISRLRAMTMKSTDREVSGYDRIRQICEAICVHRDAELAKQRVADHINEAASIAKAILHTNKRS
ncbi:GntR family transcriptional regulator [Lampropedia cohaerens]|uniref:GntR family transcriptional regulator n=1 Tax=Lampropedia cohaerens TaxID=1610491 RepID=A0A0U1Q006_9BURK|nr:GntR family transcriptional regulator [Lampropedia cohaerens]KKW68056.1 GntR family transcriptional regulator [Lampropedia cohaerens]